MEVARSCSSAPDSILFSSSLEYSTPFYCIPIISILKFYSTLVDRFLFQSFLFFSYSYSLGFCYSFVFLSPILPIESSAQFTLPRFTLLTHFIPFFQVWKSEFAEWCDPLYPCQTIITVALAKIEFSLHFKWLHEFKFEGGSKRCEQWLTAPCPGLHKKLKMKWWLSKIFTWLL